MSCAVLVLANGVSVPRKVDDWMTNVHAQAIQYDDLPGIPVERFENRSVLILGAGNAAAETADAVRNHARDIQVLGRFRRPVLMRQSHYVGDLRGRRTTHMDAFNLKAPPPPRTHVYSPTHSHIHAPPLPLPCG
jgi:thioredoxin reductase